MIRSSILASKQAFIKTSLADFHGREMHLPIRFPPREEFLKWHRENVFSWDSSVNVRIATEGPIP